jgi:uncharacterized membrane protein YfcA
MVFVGYLFLGAFAGLIAGVFGIGGGIIIVPALIFTFKIIGFPHDIATHIAVSTSLSTILFTSLGSIHGHYKKKAVNWTLAFNLSVGMFLGGMLGALCANFLSGAILQRVFAVFSFLIAVQMWFSWTPKANMELPKRFGQTVLGVVIGTFSGLFGIGGGSLVVPTLVANKVKITEAIATSAVTGFPMAVSGTIGYILLGWHRTNLPEYTFGYIYLPALFGIIITSTVFAKMGASLAHRLDPVKVTKLFSILLFIIAIKLVL